jgi:predicted ATPase with chaperone activity
MTATVATVAYFDRIDLHVDVQGVSAADLTLPPPAEGSAEVAGRVAAAREGAGQPLQRLGRKDQRRG